VDVQILDHAGFVPDPVPHRPAVHDHDLLAPVRPPGRRGQPEPAPCRDVLDRCGERLGGDVVALVDDDEAVLRKEPGKVAGTDERLQCREVDPAGELRLLPAAELADLLGAEAEVLAEPFPLLVHQRGPVHPDKRRHPVPGYQGASHDRLAGSGWRDQDTRVVLGDGVHRRLLLLPQQAAKRDIEPVRDRAQVGDVQAAARLPASAAARSAIPRGRNRRSTDSS
jgi:hypothetical protein